MNLTIINPHTKNCEVQVVLNTLRPDYSVIASLIYVGVFVALLLVFVCALCAVQRANQRQEIRDEFEEIRQNQVKPDPNNYPSQLDSTDRDVTGMEKDHMAITHQDISST